MKLVAGGAYNTLMSKFAFYILGNGISVALYGYTELGELSILVSGWVYFELRTMLSKDQTG